MNARNPTGPVGVRSPGRKAVAMALAGRVVPWQPRQWERQTVGWLVRAKRSRQIWIGLNGPQRHRSGAAMFTSYANAMAARVLGGRPQRKLWKAVPVVVRVRVEP